MTYHRFTPTASTQGNQPSYTQVGYYSTNPPQYGNPYAQQPVERTPRYPDGRRRYIGGFDPGSGYAELWVAPEDDLDSVVKAIIPSWISLMTLEEIGKRSKLLGADPVDELDEDEFVIEFEGVERGTGRLGRDSGTNRTNALNVPSRYSNEVAESLLFALCGQLIPEDRFTLRYVTALPISLYNDENRQQSARSFHAYL